MSSLEEVNRIGALSSGGVERVAWSDEEVEARSWLTRRCSDLGLEVEQDEAGNVWAWAGRRPAVVLGSHLDSVPNGGRFDGALGVIAALEVLRAAREAGAPGAERLALVCFTDEEGVRFGTGMTGSRAVAGLLEPDELRGALDHSGLSLWEALERRGLDPAAVGAAARRRPDMAAYLELHVEQGRRLERLDVPVGVVSGIVGLSHWHVRVEGESNHAGTTLPDDRRDALVPAAATVLRAQRCMRERDGVMATVGEAGVVGGATNIVPGEVRFTLDVRSANRNALEAALKDIFASLDESAETNGCKVHREEVKRFQPVDMAEEAVAALGAAVEGQGVEPVLMPSMAGHDGMNLARAGVPCGMLFVRSTNGISHSPDEHSSSEDCALAAMVIGDAALTLARGLD